MNLALQAAQAQLQDPPLTPKARQDWNNFIDYLEKTGYKGSTLLDNKDTALGGKLLDQYKTINPDFSLDYNAVKQVQQDLQDHRASVVNAYRKNPASVEGVKSEDEIMSGLSGVDGWLGSKTSSWRYPQARKTSTTPTGTNVQNFGTDLAAYEAAMAKLKPK